MTAYMADLETLSKRQLGLVTTTQLKSRGWSRNRTRWAVTRGLIVSIRPGVWRLAAVPISWEQFLLATTLSAGDGSFISFTTAAAVWNFRHSERYGFGLQLSGQRRVKLKGVTFHRATFRSDETTTRDGIPVTTAERTLIDWASNSRALPGAKLGECVDDALRRGLIDLRRLRSLADRLHRQGHRRLDRVHSILEARLPGYRPDESDFETRMNRLWDELGLPPAERQFRLRVSGHSYRLDRALVAEKIAVEWDSDRYHSYPSDRDHDSDRTARLVAAGWLVIRVTANTTPELVANAVERARQDRALSGLGVVTGR